MAGAPGAGAFNATLNGTNLISTGGYGSNISGQIPWLDPAGGSNSYLATFNGNATIAGNLLLCDRLWHNGNISVTVVTSQAIVSPTWPARDATGGTVGTGLLCLLEVSAATGTGTPGLLLTYTNTTGGSGRLGSNIIPTLSSSAIGAVYFIGLQAGDTGIRSIEEFSLSATWNSGTVNLVVYRVLASLPLSGAFIPYSIDAVTGGLPRLYNGSVPWLIFVPNTTTATNVSGQVVFTQG